MAMNEMNKARIKIIVIFTGNTDCGCIIVQPKDFLIIFLENFKNYTVNNYVGLKWSILCNVSPNRYWFKCFGSIPSPIRRSVVISSKNSCII